MSNDEKTVVLIADDEPSTLALLGRHLRSKGYNVLEASDGDEAWELAHEHLPDLVLLDVMMPGMSGWEVCRKIREAVSLAHTGVVMLTGIGETLNEMTSPLYGADAHVDKPFEFSALDRKLSETLERRRAGALGRPDSGQEDMQVSFAPSDAPEPITTRKLTRPSPAEQRKPAGAPKKAAAKNAKNQPETAAKAAPKPAKKAAKTAPAAKPAKPAPPKKSAKKTAKKTAKKSAKRAPKAKLAKAKPAPKAKAAKKTAKAAKKPVKATKPVKASKPASKTKAARKVAKPAKATRPAPKAKGAKKTAKAKKPSKPAKRAKK